MLKVPRDHNPECPFAPGVLLSFADDDTLDDWVDYVLCGNKRIERKPHNDAEREEVLAARMKVSRDNTRPASSPKSIRVLAKFTLPGGDSFAEYHEIPDIRGAGVIARRVIADPTHAERLARFWEVARKKAPSLAQDMFVLKSAIAHLDDKSIGWVIGHKGAIVGQYQVDGEPLKAFRQAIVAFYS